MSSAQTEPSAVIRPARPADIDALCRLGVRAWAPILEERTRILGEDLMRRDRGGDPAEAKAQAIRAHCEWDLSTVLVTEVEGEIAGFIAFRPMAEAGIIEIDLNAIDPDYQGRGLGKAQYQYLLNWARENGFRYARVGTGLDDCFAPARAAYEKAGFNLAIPSVTYYCKL